MSIPARVLQALVAFTSPNPLRTALHGIRIEREPGLHARTTCVATDGRRLLAVSLPTMGSAEPSTFTIPAALAWHAEASEMIHLEKLGDGVRTQADKGLLPVIIGFPTYWAKEMPTDEPTGQSAWALNLGFLHSFSVAFSILDPERPGACVRHYEGGRYLIRTACADALYDATGLLMGLVTPGRPAVPAWWQVSTEVSTPKLEEAAAQP